MTPGPAARPTAPGALPGTFYGWTAAAAVSTFGDSALYFALGWAASSLGAGTAGLVLTMINLPRSLLLLAGGALGDRWGPRRVLIGGHAVMCALTVLLAALVQVNGVTRLLLLGAGLAIGSVEAFYLPSSVAMPRLFADDAALPRALALNGSSSQVIRLMGGPVSGVLVATAGLAGATFVDSLTFAVSLLVLCLIRPPRPTTRPSSNGAMGSLVRDGIRLVVGDPLLRTVLGALALFAASVLPTTSLCVPLLAREHGWAASTAGLIVGSSVGGGLALSLTVARRGAFGRPGMVAASGAVLAALGIVGLGLSTTVPYAVAAALVQGVGVSAFGSHVAPLLLASAPGSHVTRLSSILMLLQVLPLIASNNLVGLLASHASAQVATMACAGATAGAGVLLLSHRLVRGVRYPAGRQRGRSAPASREHCISRPDEVTP
ncbi:MAG: MFS transporter [Actinocatenispora sp.]